MSTKKCDHCGEPLAPWDLADLLYHQRRLARGEHAACACNDDCAVECAPWSRQRLARAIAKATN